MEDETPPDAIFERAQSRYTPAYVEKRLKLLAIPEYHRDPSKRPSLPRLPEDYGPPMRIAYTRRPIHKDERRVKYSKTEPDPLAARMGEVGLFLRMLDRLGELPRQVLEVCVISGLSYKEFGDEHHISPSTVYRIKKQAIEDIAFWLGWRPSEEEE